MITAEHQGPAAGRRAELIQSRAADKLAKRELTLAFAFIKLLSD